MKDVVFSPITVADLNDCLKTPSQIIQTALGPVEDADRGEGPVILSAHGGPGGYDQGLGMSEVFRKAGYRILSPSRPGYLRTPTSPGQTVEEQADLLAAFLDALHIDQAIVLATCAGGPPTYQLAQRHPQKVKALVEIDSITLRFKKDDQVSKMQEIIYLSKPGIWIMEYMLRQFPKAVVKQFMKTESTLLGKDLEKRVSEILDDEAKLLFVNYLFTTMSTHYDLRKAGLVIDFKIFDSYDALPMDKISCPALIVHGNADKDVPPEHGEYAFKSIKNAEMLWVDKGSHIGFWVADDAYAAQEKALKWLAAL